MPPAPDDVNDRASREDFLRRGTFDALAALRTDAPAEWGRMTAQEMVEHLAWSFELSTGRASVVCPVPEPKRERYKAFLRDNTPMPHEIANPALVAGLPPLRHASLADAIDVLRREVAHYFERAAAEPGARYTHPVFGSLDAEQWSRSHFKHVRHHLLQFRLIDG